MFIARSTRSVKGLGAALRHGRLVAIAVLASSSVSFAQESQDAEPQTASGQPTEQSEAAAGSASTYRAALRSLRLAGEEPDWEALLAQYGSDGVTLANLQHAWVHELLEGVRIDDAARFADQALAASQEDAELMVARAEVHLAQVNYSDAGQLFYQAVKADPNLPDAHYGLAWMFESERRMVSARRHYQRAYELAPDSAPVQRAWMRATPDPSERDRLEREWFTSLVDEVDAEDEERFLSEFESRIRVEQQLRSRGGICRLRSKPEPDEMELLRLRPTPTVSNSFGLPLEFGGKQPENALVDTGASGILISRSLAREADLETVGRAVVYGLGEEGARIGELALAPRIAIGNLVFEDCLVEIMDDKVFNLESFRALIGLDLLYDHYRVKLDFGRLRLGLTPLAALPTKAGGSPDRFAVERSASDVPEGFAAVRIIHEDFIVPTLIENEGQTGSYFLIDTGASTSVISKRAASRVGELTWSRRRARGLSGEIEGIQQTGPTTLAVLGIGQRYKSLTAIDLDRRNAIAYGGIDGLIGHDFLQHVVLTLDGRHALVKLEVGEKQRKPRKRRTVL